MNGDQHLSDYSIAKLTIWKIREASIVENDKEVVALTLWSNRL
jgi:hypothetical protein